MPDIKIIAAILLVGRLISELFIAFVILRQYRLFKITAPAPIKALRKALFGISLFVFFGNMIPIFLDVATILADNSLEREDSPSVVGVAYAFSNNITFMAISILLWYLYRLAASQLIDTDETEAELRDALRKKS